MKKIKKFQLKLRKKLKRNQWRNQRKIKQKHSGEEKLKFNKVSLMSLELLKRIQLMLQQRIQKQFKKQVQIHQKLQMELKRRKNLKKNIISKFFQNQFQFHLIVCNLKIYWIVTSQFWNFFRVLFWLR
jgi:hypothetical protein